MTLIAAFWCHGQAVICADSQETVGDYRVSVDKIVPKTLAGGRYQIAYAASGDAPLVDLLGTQIEAALEVSKATSIAQFSRDLGSTLVKFYASNSVDFYSNDEDRKLVRGIVCIRIPNEKQVFLFKLDRTIASPIQTFELVGWDHTVYRTLAKRLYYPEIAPLHAQLIGLRILSEASASQYVGPPFVTVFAMTNGMFAHNRSTDHYVSNMISVQAAMDHLLFACADTHSVHDSEVRKRVNVFKNELLRLRREHKKNLRRDQKEEDRLRAEALRAIGIRVRQSTKHGRKAPPPSQG